MITIFEIKKKYFKKIDILDLELIIAHIIKKPREFILTHPEKKLTPQQIEKISNFTGRRLKHEPIAYILGQKEFYGLDFKVTKDTLIPRPETELLVELATHNIKHEVCSYNNTTIIDLGTGSGNIIVSVAKKIDTENLLHASCFMLYGIDISKKALTIAKHNAKKNNVADKIKFLRGNLLEPIIKNINCYMLHASCSMIIIANLPYLSKKNYSATMPDVKNFEPKSALLSGIDGLNHYEKLFQQIRSLSLFIDHCSLIIEISPEQKQKIEKLIKKYFPDAKIDFQKDLAQKWRIASFDI